MFVRADDGIANIREMPHLHAFMQRRIFDFAEVPHMDVTLQVRSFIAARTDPYPRHLQALPPSSTEARTLQSFPIVVLQIMVLGPITFSLTDDRSSMQVCVWHDHRILADLHISTSI